MATKRRLLWIGDAGVNTGFARCTHEILKAFDPRFDIHVLALGYDGDSNHGLPWTLYRAGASAAGDGLGLGRVADLVSKLGPTVVVVQNDPWNFSHYLQRAGNCPVVGIVAVDGKNCRGTQMNGLAHAIYWTEFGQREARLGGYTGSSSVVPLGVDLDTYCQRAGARERMNLPAILNSRGLPPDTFIVGVVGRNQQRKRLDLTLEYFANWVHEHDVADAALWIQQAPTGERAYDVEQLGKYYRISDRLITPAAAKDQQGLSEQVMARVYNVFDVMMSTTQGEGWGLPQMEGMACGVPQVVPDWAALGDWATAALRVPCYTTAATPQGVNVLGGIPDRREFCAALDRLYRSAELRTQHADAGLRLVCQPQYRWTAIGKAVVAAVESAVFAHPVVGQQQQEAAC